MSSRLTKLLNRRTENPSEEIVPWYAFWPINDLLGAMLMERACNYIERMQLQGFEPEEATCPDYIN